MPCLRAVLLLSAVAATAASGVVQGNTTERIARPVLRGVKDAQQVQALAAANATRTTRTNRTAAAAGARIASAPPCTCQSSSGAWKRPTRTVPKCIFVDLGAANGNTFENFLANGYGPISGCNNGQYEAFLVEANPRFKAPLDDEAKRHPGQAHSLASTAAYMCEAQTSFYVDTVNTATNFWGSSMSENHRDVISSGKKKVTVPTVNIMKLIYENTIPADWVMLKMDIEGAEWDVLPCLANSPAAPLVDRLYLEEHPQSWSLTGTSNEVFQGAKASLKQQHVDIPQYFSQTF